jgi:hypothetical protein
MAQYYADRPSVTRQTLATRESSVSADAPVLSEFDKLRETLLTDDIEEGWSSELRRYLSTMQREVTKDTDLIEWWQVSCFLRFGPT